MSSFSIGFLAKTANSKARFSLVTELLTSHLPAGKLNNRSSAERSVAATLSEHLQAASGDDFDDEFDYDFDYEDEDDELLDDDDLLTEGDESDDQDEDVDPESVELEPDLAGDLEEETEGPETEESETLEEE